jgi:hypothetical protein
MYLVISYLDRVELDKRIVEKTIGESDFIALHIRYNDPQTSFFVMRSNVPHGEAIINIGKRVPSFYVTESKNLPLDFINFHDYELKIQR